MTKRASSIFAALGHRFPIYSPLSRFYTPHSLVAANHLIRQQYRSQSTSKAVAKTENRVNPSSTTLPAPLDVPSRGKDQSLFNYLLKSGKSYLQFYKIGIKNIWSNYKTATLLQQRLRSTQTPQLPPSPSSHATHKNLYTKFVLTRAEFQFLRRSRHDISRVPAFGLLFLILGEWLPLVVIFFTPLVPYTCRIPRQIEKARETLEKRRSDSFRGVREDYVPSPNGRQGEVRELRECEKKQVMHISRSLGLHGRMWDYTRGVLPPSALLRWRVGKWLDYLEQDDTLLLRDGGVEELKSEELKLAAEQRGLDVLKKKDDKLRKVLKAWMKGRSEGQVLPMLLTRPSAWKS